MFGGRFGVSQTGRGRQLAHYFVGFFHQIKVRQQIGRKVSIQPIFRKSKMIGGFFEN
jgi:hypothetical protein